jgi:hypothetical protein
LRATSTATSVSFIEELKLWRMLRCARLENWIVSFSEPAFR